MNVDENDENLPLNEADEVHQAEEASDDVVSAELVSEEPEIVLLPDEKPDAGDEQPFLGTLVDPNDGAVSQPIQPIQNGIANQSSPTSLHNPEASFSSTLNKLKPEPDPLPFTALSRLMQVLLIVVTLCSVIFFFWYCSYESQLSDRGIRFARNAFFIFAAGVSTFVAIFRVRPQHVGNDVRSFVCGSLLLATVGWLLTFPARWSWVTFTWSAVHIPLAIVMNLSPKPESERSDFDLHDSVAANGGAVASVVLGIWSILGSLFSTLSIINSIMGIALGMWGLTSRKQFVAVTGIMLCLVGIMACMFNLTFFVWESDVGLEQTIR